MKTKTKSQDKPPFIICSSCMGTSLELRNKGKKIHLGYYRDVEQASQAVLDIVLIISNFIKPTRKRMRWTEVTKY